jgi:hypothetical protein
LYGDGFASIDGALSMSAFGPGARALARRESLFRGHQKQLTGSLHRSLPLPARLWCAPDTGHNRALAAALQRMGK